MCYEFPGGGIEEGLDIAENIRKECLEEIGVQVKNIVSLELALEYEVNYPNPERAKMYRGGKDHWYTAEFVKVDNHLHNTEGDALDFEWVQIDRAMEMIKTGPESSFNPTRLKALERTKKHLAKKAVGHLQEDKIQKLKSW